MISLSVLLDRLEFPQLKRLAQVAGLPQGRISTNDLRQKLKRSRKIGILNVVLVMTEDQQRDVKIEFGVPLENTLLSGVMEMRSAKLRNEYLTKLNASNFAIEIGKSKSGLMLKNSDPSRFLEITNAEARLLAKFLEKVSTSVSYGNRIFEKKLGLVTSFHNTIRLKKKRITDEPAITWDTTLNIDYQMKPYNCFLLTLHVIPNGREIGPVGFKIEKLADVIADLKQ